MAARSSSTRSARCRSRCRPSCCASSRPAASSRSAAAAPEKVDVRFVCATNRDPLAEVEAGRFREDLYYRLYVVPIELPPLRERGEDVLLIARALPAPDSAEEEGKRLPRLRPGGRARRCSAYPWPGNVRQLQNVVRNVVVLHDGEQGGAGDAAGHAAARRPAARRGPPPPTPPPCRPPPPEPPAAGRLPPASRRPGLPPSGSCRWPRWSAG